MGETEQRGREGWFGSYIPPRAKRRPPDPEARVAFLAARYERCLDLWSEDEVRLSGHDLTNWVQYQTGIKETDPPEEAPPPRKRRKRQTV